MVGYAKRTLRTLWGEISHLVVPASIGWVNVADGDRTRGQSPLRETARRECPQADSRAAWLLLDQIEYVRHSTEFGKGTSFHLPHQVDAMNLHRGFSDADIVGNLLV